MPELPEEPDVPEPDAPDELVPEAPEEPEALSALLLSQPAKATPNAATTRNTFEVAITVFIVVPFINIGCQAT